MMIIWRKLFPVWVIVVGGGGDDDVGGLSQLLVTVSMAGCQKRRPIIHSAVTWSADVSTVVCGLYYGGCPSKRFSDR